METDIQYDVVIIGGGLGGLLCGAILSKEGLKVCILEKDKQIGGCLQTFAFHKKVFEACVHYIGGLGEGHSLHRIFKYVGIIDKLRLERLDPMGFDEVQFGDDKNVYSLANEENFIERLSKFFPEERNNLVKYVALINETVAAFPLYNLRSGSATEKEPYADLELWEIIKGITSNLRLQQVLLGNNFLYAGVKGKTPWYVHALVTHSYMHSAHRILPGSSQIAKELSKIIKSNDGNIIRSSDVNKFEVENGKIFSAKSMEKRFKGNFFISAIHPGKMLELIHDNNLRPAYRKRVVAQNQSPSSVMLNIVLQPNTIAAQHHNTYWHAGDLSISDGHKMPDTYCLFFSNDSDSLYAETLSVLIYEKFDNYSDWASSVSFAGNVVQRPASYMDYKQKIASGILEKLYVIMPELRENILDYSVATPLTFRDYTGTPEGSLYGMMKDVALPQAGNLAVRTRIPNLLLTGQNVGLHGVLGVSMTALLTCGEIIGLEYLLKKINAA